MLLTPVEFTEKHFEDDVQIALVGMSNIGKSTLSRIIEEYANAHRTSIDAIIYERLGFNDNSKRRTKILADWLGTPDEDAYHSRKKEYLNHEETALQEQNVRKAKGNKILDTTGSIVYVNPSVLSDMQKHYIVVHLALTDTIRESLIDIFTQQPKPVIWSSYILENSCQKGKNCIDYYPELLEERESSYRALADISIPADFIAHPYQHNRLTFYHFYDAIHRTLEEKNKER